MTRDQFAELLARLPEKRSTRISLARMIGEYIASDGDEMSSTTSFVEYRNLTELGGFVAAGPIRISDTVERVGAGEYRVCAYGLDGDGLRWEVFVTLGEEAAGINENT